MQRYLARAENAIEWCRTLATMSEEPGVTTRTFLSRPMRRAICAVCTQEPVQMRGNW
jgi:hypothetical protein